ncbi:MAG: DedA family protein [Microbacteriaceae bacterium]|nr:DedA family protein [Microbacteriaceae bacterium]
MIDPLNWILTFVGSVDPVLRTAIAGVGMVFETSILLGLLVPGDTIVLVTSTGVTSLPQYFVLILVVIVGSLLGESVGFALGRFFGPRIRASRIGARLGEPHWIRAENYLARRGGPAVLISRFLPVLHSLIPVTVGMSKMRFRQFMAWTLPACVIWAVSYVTVGALAAGSYRAVEGELKGAGYLFAGIVLAFVVVVIIVKKLLLRRETHHMHDQQSASEQKPDVLGS